MDDLQVGVLLIEDDEDDYVLVQSLLSEVEHVEFRLEWAKNYDEGRRAIERGNHDVCLLDYQLGERDGLDLLRDSKGADGVAPVIILTGHGNYDLDLEAMEAGAADYLMKEQITAYVLERSIRYAIEHKRSERQLKSLSSRLLSAQEEERRRIAAELHDSIGSSLSAIKFSLETALAQGEQGKTIIDTLRALVSMVQNAIDDSRRIMTDLRPSILDDLGIIATIQWFCRQFQMVYSSISIEQEINVEEEKIPEHLKIVLFRTMQEALNNIAKYSKADLVNLSLEKQGQLLSLTISDNGTGFDEKLIFKKIGNKGLGLASMRERAELTHGAFNIESELGKGTRISISWRE
ncbi:MAG: response regulator [Syntrophobacteraceae bacterium]